MINNIDYRIRRRNYLRYLASKINDAKLTLKKYPNTEWLKTKLKKMEAQYETIKRHSTTTKQKT